MSALTKIFVALLVVLSLLLTAGVVVFVNLQDDFVRERNANVASLQQTQASLMEAKVAAESQAAAANTALAAANSQVENYRAQLSTSQESLSKSNTENAKVNAQLTLASTNVTNTVSLLTSLQQAYAVLNTQTGELRTASGDRLGQIGELNKSLTDVTNRYEVAEEARRLLAEQLTELKGQFDKVSSSLRDMGVDPTRLATAGIAAGAPPINGVVREKTDIKGVPYATISVGSDDAVKQGMQFQVLDSTSGKFLGTLTVTIVETNQAVGRLSGPAIADVTSGAEVRTQL